MTTGRSSMSFLGSGGAMGGAGTGAGVTDVSDFMVSSLVSGFLGSNVFCGEYDGVTDSPYEYLTEREMKTDNVLHTVSTNELKT